MVLFSTSEEWQRQSSLLLQARPTTARITTKYKIPNLDSPKYQKPKKRKRDNEQEDKDSAPKVPRGVLVLKTYCPESGVVLKFKTDRAAEVGRLINGLGSLGRHMAALPQKTGDLTIEDAPAATKVDATEPTAASNATPAAAADSKPQPGAGGGGGKKKKKGKK